MILGNKCDMEDKRVVSKERGEAVSKFVCLVYIDIIINKYSLFASGFIITDLG